MNGLESLASWIVQAGLAGRSETELLSGFSERAVALGFPLHRTLVVIDTLHPVHEGRVFNWRADGSAPPVVEYGRTDQGEARERWQRSPFYHLLQMRETMLRRRLNVETEAEFWVFPELRAAGMTDYIAIVTPFAAQDVLGEMDCVYSSWATADRYGFSDIHVAELQRLVPLLALSVKSVSLERVAGTLVETYLGRDAGRRVLAGRIARGVADRIEAVLWFSDLRGYTKITDTAAPEHIIPLLNDYADAIVSAIHDQGGDVLKLMGDGVLAIFTGGDRESACRAALGAADAARRDVAELNVRRQQEGLPVTEMYLGLHAGEVFYGNVGSKDRLDFTVVGPAVNEVSRIAAMCRSVDQPVLMSSTFVTALGDHDGRAVSVGRFALRGVGTPQHLFTLDPAPRVES
jgi:adenylate cyclase